MVGLQVDLETGKRRSWVETEEKEMIDLCGETPGQSHGGREGWRGYGAGLNIEILCGERIHCSSC
jgi:hypothetical protein